MSIIVNKESIKLVPGCALTLIVLKQLILPEVKAYIPSYNCD